MCVTMRDKSGLKNRKPKKKVKIKAKSLIDFLLWDTSAATHTYYVLEIDNY